MNAEKMLNTLLAHSTRDINLCARAYYLIAGATESEQPVLLKQFLTEYKKVTTDYKEEMETLISENEKYQLAGVYQDSSDEFFLSLRQENPTEDDFYRKLWKYIDQDPELRSDNARIFVLYNMAIDTRMPYYQLGWDRLVHMEHDTFRLFNEILDEAGYSDKLEYIFKYPLKQKTERASLINNLMEEIPSREMKAVLLSRILSHYEACTLAALHTASDFDCE